MNKKINVIKINGFKGILLAVFIIGCLIAGFLIFPGWVCKNIWNFTAEYFTAMPSMSLIHGSILWVIVALSTYALNQGKLSISIGSTPVQTYREYNEARINDILKQISEKNETLLSSKPNTSDSIDNESKDDTDKITKE